MPVHYYTVTASNEGQRLDNFLTSYLTGVPKSKIYSIIRKGEVRVNKGRIGVHYRLVIGDSIRIPPVRVAENVPTDIKPNTKFLQSIEDAICYEDDDLIVVNKPTRMAVHGGSGISLGLIEALRHSRPDAAFLELVHRLDRDTSGLIMVAKKRRMLVHLHDCLREGRIKKEYLALVAGQWRGNRVVEAPLLKYLMKNDERMVKVSPEGKFAKTQFEVIQSFEHATLLKAMPVTGRTHQIRVHCTYMGHPILGDEKYDGAKELQGNKVNRLFLHAHRLTIELPYEPFQLIIDCPMPQAFEDWCQILKR